MHDGLVEHAAWIKGYSGLRAALFRTQLGFRGFLASIFFRGDRDAIPEQGCDVLFIKRGRGNAVFQRIAEKFEFGLRHVEIVGGRPADWMSDRELIFEGSTPSALRLYRARAEYLMRRFNPKVIVTEHNGSILSPVLKSVAAEHGAVVVHLAHSLPTPNYRNFSLIDYHYYIAYGDSSYKLLQRQDRLFGDARFVYAGSCHIQHRLASQASPVRDDPTTTFVLLGSGPGIEQRGEADEIYSNAIALVSSFPGATLLFKPHPRSNIELWKRLVRDKPEQQFEIIESLRQSPSGAIAFSGYTNAIIDVAVLGMIPVLMGKGPEDDFFYYSEFFGAPVCSAAELSAKLREINERRAHYLVQVDQFKRFHLSAVDDPIAYVARFLGDLARSMPVEEYVSRPRLMHEFSDHNKPVYRDEKIEITP